MSMSKVDALRSTVPADHVESRERVGSRERAEIDEYDTAEMLRA